MQDKIIFEKDIRTVKNPKHLQKVFFCFTRREILPLNQQLTNILIQK